MAIAFSTTNAEGYGNGITLLVFGESGSGKTTLLGTYPDGKILIISTENKLLALKGRNIHVIVVTTFQDFKDAITFVSTPENIIGFEAIAVDSITNIAKQLFKELMLILKDGRQVYGEMAEQMNAELKRLSLIKKHKILVAQQGSIDVGNNTTKNGPGFPGRQLGKDIPYMCDHIVAARVTVDTDGKTAFMLQTVPDYQYMAKGSPNLAPFEEPNLPLIVSKILS